MSRESRGPSEYTAAIALGWALFAVYLIWGGLGAPWDIDESFRAQVIFHLAEGKRVNVDFMTFYIEPLFQLLSWPIVLFPARLLPYAIRGFGMLCVLFAAMAVARTLKRITKIPAGLALAFAPISMTLIIDIAARLYHYRANALSYGLILLAISLLFLEPRRKYSAATLLGLAFACQMETAVPISVILMLYFVLEPKRDRLIIPLVCCAACILPGIFAYGPVGLAEALIAEIKMGQIVPAQYGPYLPSPVGDPHWFWVALIVWALLAAYGLLSLKRLGHGQFAAVISTVCAVHLIILALGANRIYWQHFTLELLLAAPALSVALVMLTKGSLARIGISSARGSLIACCALILLIWTGSFGRLASDRLNKRDVDPARELQVQLLEGDDCFTIAMNNFYRPYTLAQVSAYFSALAYSCPAPQAHYGDELYSPQLPHIPLGITGIYQHPLHLREGTRRDPQKQGLLSWPVGMIGREIFEDCPAEFIMHSAPCALLDDPLLYRLAAVDAQFREWLLMHHRRVIVRASGRPIILFIREDRELAPNMQEVGDVGDAERAGLLGLLGPDGSSGP